jgi:long-chain acyl-CoA synthetase
MIVGSFESIPALFLRRVEKTPTGLFLKYKEGPHWVDRTWEEGKGEVFKIARSLIALGVVPGTKVSILSYTTAPWILTDLGILSAGGVTVPIYQSNTPEECKYILDNSETEILFVENELQLEKIKAVRKDLPRLKKVIVHSGEVKEGDWVLGYSSFLELGRNRKDEEVLQRIEKIRRGDLLTLVYTSGTTGPPKGTMLIHGNFDFVTEAVQKIMPLGEEDICLLFLPLAHIFARIIEMGAIRTGYGIAICEGIDKILDNLKEVRPTFMPSVPRIYEKVYSTIRNQVDSAGGLKKAIFLWSLKVGREVSQYRQQKKPLPFSLALPYRIANRLVYSKLKATFGGRLRFFISGGAPLSREIAEFFHAADLLILEGYGLTETTAVTNVNTPDWYKFGVVGRPIPGVEQKIAPDGEILSRGPGIMLGYYKREEDTKEAIDEEGWFHTGDIGEFDQDGFLRITDRKKDIIVTAGGKNIAPQNIENLVKSHLPYVSQIVVYGDKRKYLTALITLDGEVTARFLKEQNLLPEEEIQELLSATKVLTSASSSASDRKSAMERRIRILTKVVEHPQVLRWVEAGISEVNKKLASYETIKKFKILPGDFSIDGGELTPTLKVKRKVIFQRYKDLFDSMYDEKYD